MGHCLFIVLIEQTALLHKLQDYEVAFLQLLLISVNYFKDCGKLWKLSKFGSDFQCVYYNNKFVVLYVSVCVFHFGIFFFSFWNLNYVCLHGKMVF